MTIGLVYYSDDPDKKVFRMVYPIYSQGETDEVLNDPQWVTLGCDPKRTATIVKAKDTDPLIQNGTLGTPASEATLAGVSVVKALETAPIVE